MLALNLFLPDSPGWVVVPLSASAATCIGLLYPYVLGEDKDAPDGSKVMRCVAVFVGIYQASIVSSFFYGVRLLSSKVGQRADLMLLSVYKAASLLGHSPLYRL